jgi:alpha-galactosidase
MQGEVHRIGSPGSSRCAVQYTAGDRVVVCAWNAGGLDGRDGVPARAVRLPLRGLDPAARYGEFSGAHLMAVGLPVRWTPGYDADLFELERQ